MTPALISLLLPVLKSAVSKAAPDKPQADQILNRLEEELIRLPAADEQAFLKHQMFAEARQAQAEITKTESTHRSLFVAGWRPMCGWACSLAVFRGAGHGGVHRRLRAGYPCPAGTRTSDV